MIKSVEIEEDTILYKLHNNACKKGRNVVSMRASEVVDFSSQYGSTDSISYTADNIVGPPTIYPRTGDNAYSFQLRTYGEWWDGLPSSRKSRVSLPAKMEVESQDFVEFRVEKPVLPLLFRIYEVYNPGAIVKILCYCYKPERWVVLWQGRPQFQSPNESHCFTIEAKKIDFVTDYYRIEFHHKHLKYFFELDGLILYGEDKIPPNTSHLCSHLKLSNQQSDSLSTCETPAPSERLKSDDSSYFDMLPNEVIHNILSFVDLQTLCTVSRVCKLFYKLSYDPILYHDVNLQLYWTLVDVNALKSLQPRLTSMKKLNLSWCGGQNRITPSFFIEFVESTCQCLTSLKLSNCQFLNNNCLKAISHHCPKLKELELQNCLNTELTPKGFQYIACMGNLIYLDLYRTLIDNSSILCILRSLKLQHLFLGNCTNITEIDDVAKDIGKYLKDTIKTLDLWRSTDLSCQGMYEIARHCHELVELDLGWCYQVDASCGCIRQLISQCPKLKKLFLTAIRTISSNDLWTIATHCLDLEQLDILGTNEVSLQAVKDVLQSCKKLRLLDISYCNNGIRACVDELEAFYPNVSIKCSSSLNFDY